MEPKTTASGHMSGDVIAQIISRAASPGYETWWQQVEHAGYCSSPVELHGRDPQGRPVKILTRCKNRRASVCPSCSALYSGDTWQLVHQGIHRHPAPEGVSRDGRAMVFATLTAPSYGPMHTSHRTGGPCRPRPGTATRCAHGTVLRCLAIHDTDDPRLGEPLCPDCYDYLGHVLFTWHAPQLWHRFTVTLRRLVKQGDRAARVSYVKVVELQRRGVPHFHTVIRLDESGLPTTTLAALVHQAAATARLEVPGFGGELVELRFGTQIDVQPLRSSKENSKAGDDDRRVASYLAKYVTKSVSDLGLSPHRISPRALPTLDVRPHIRDILWTILTLADSPGPAEMTRWLHTLGYRGHITTKTRAYSTTMGALRAQRAKWTAARAESGDEEPATARDWHFVRSGHHNDGERLLAQTAGTQARTSRLTAREELACEVHDE